jgi:hypothetical protein
MGPKKDNDSKVKRKMNSAWRKFWPDCVAGRDFEGFDNENFAVVDDTVSLGKNMGLEINNEYVEELLEDHKNELSSEKLKQLQEQQQKTIVEEMSSDKEEGSKDVSSSLIRKICAKWGEVQSFMERYHPDKVVASRSINIFNDNAMFHFRNILKCRQKQITLDKFCVRQRPSESQAESSGAKRQKKKKPQEDSYLMFLWKGTPLLNNN